MVGQALTQWLAWGLIGLVLAVAALLLGLLGRLARRRGLSRVRWQLLTAMLWGFLWVGSRQIDRYLRNQLDPASYLMANWNARLLLITLGLCLLAWLSLFLTLKRRTPVQQNWDKIDQIGESPQDPKDGA